MPAKNALKPYVKDAYYHIYNRGVDKRLIFQDVQDYKVFLSYLKLYLSPPNLQGLSLKVSPSRQLNNYAQEISLLCYCLMPNHFHLLIKQHAKTAMADFMRSLGTKYSTYFNRKNGRTGTLFQGRYKAVLVETDEQLLHLSRYIHQNPFPLLTTGTVLEDYPFSSFPNYLQKFSQSWVKTDLILSYFSYPSYPRSIQNYQAFVYETDETTLEETLLLDTFKDSP